jgi:serine protease Do
MRKLFATSLAGCVTVLSLAGAQSARAQSDASQNWWVQQPDSQVFFQLTGTPTSYMGVNLADITSERAQALKLRDVYGVEITRIEENSPAEKAGLKVGDVVLEYNGQRVEGMEQFGRFVRETPVGREVKLLISRDGNQRTLTVTIGSRRDMLHALTGPEFKEFRFNMPEINVPMPDMPLGMQTWRTALLGVEAESLGPQLAEYFGVKEGVLVRAVLKDSAAEKAGLKAGDVITKVDQQAVSSPAELSSAIRAARSKTAFPVQIVRERRDMSVNVTIANPSPQGASPVRMRIVSMPPQKM